MDMDILRKELLQEYQDVFDSDKPLKAMAGEPVKIKPKKGAKPFKVNGPRPIPIPMRSEVKKLLDDLEAKGVIEKVTTPTDWVHPMTCVRKSNGKLRLCVDLRQLNKHGERPVYPTRSPKDVVSGVPASARWFSTFDASSGYFQVPLAEESQELTTFITPWGRYKHKRATMGLNCASDEYNMRGDMALSDIANMAKLVDNVLLYDGDLTEHIASVRRFLTRCREQGITLNPEKFQLAKPSVKFAGYQIGREGIKVDPGSSEPSQSFQSQQT